MKNIHIIPTDKQSRLFYPGNSSKLTLNKYAVLFRVSPQNIYITNDESRQRTDWVVYKDAITKLEVGDNELFHLGKKIILTTDQDLIKDGVQEIPEYFLIHYIVGNNPIEYVEIKEHLESLDTMKINYEIIIPKEEPDYTALLQPVGTRQETLEEAAERLYPIILEDDGWDKNKQYRDEWTKGAKWQQKNSEEEVIQLVSDWTDYRMSEDSKSKVTFKKWFEKFKK
jgi:hypothetical protein